MAIGGAGWKSRAVGWGASALALSAAVGWLTGLFRASTCETYDEYTYLWMGYCVFRQGAMRELASPMTPPLPILLEYWWPALGARSYPGVGNWIWEVPEMTRRARVLTAWTLGVPLVLAALGWAGRRRGVLAGAFAGGMLAMSPTVLAASSVATTDACFAAFSVAALACLHRYQVRPGLGSWCLAGSGIGLSIAAKQSGAFLFAPALLELWRNRPERRGGSTAVDRGVGLGWWLGSRMLGLVSLAFLVDWACYGFALAPPFGSGGTSMQMPVLIPMVVDLLPNSEAIMDRIRAWGPPMAIDTFVGQMNHASEGHSAFLMGQHSRKGWWYFFPVAILIKSTPAELAMMAMVLASAVRRGFWVDPARRLWLASAACLLGAGMASSINIGHRYMLPIYPMVALIAADLLGELGSTRWRRWAACAGLAMVAGQGASLAGIAPHYLGYFNAIVGGPSQGYRYLVDSSLDWGQDLPALRRELEARHYRRVALDYFGTANAEVNGIRSVDWLHNDAGAIAECDWLAVSASRLQGAYGSTRGLADRLLELPSGRAGYSIFLYDLKDPRVRRIFDDVRRLRAGPDPRAPREDDGP